MHDTLRAARVVQPPDEVVNEAGVIEDFAQQQETGIATETLRVRLHPHGAIE